MPINMRLHVRSEYPMDETPPSTRPSSAASSAPSTASTPHRSTSMDSINTSFSAGEKHVTEELIPTRMLTTAPKINTNALQFIKTGPANLHRSAKDQMKKSQVVKTLRKTAFEEEEEWQSNLDKWKSSRRKKNEGVLERVIEVKKNEQEGSNTRRKSKTFSEMREETGKKGRKYNIVVYNDDNNDLADLGLGGTKSDGETKDESIEEQKDDSKDAKSDAGFCTGSDTGSDGVFPEDNVSDTSSAIEDKKDTSDTTHNTASIYTQNITSSYSNNTSDYSNNTSDYSKNTSDYSKNTSDYLKNTSDYSKNTTSNYTNNKSEFTQNSLSEFSQNSLSEFSQNSLSEFSQNSTSEFSQNTESELTQNTTSEYTYDKAIEDYKQFAENSAKKRNPLVNSVSSSHIKEYSRLSSPSGTIDDKVAFLSEQQPKVIRRHKLPKVDLNKRRSMFELRSIGCDTQKVSSKRSFETGLELKSRVMSFENINNKFGDDKKRAVTVPRDTNFKQKLANFTHETTDLSSVRKKTPERDQNFYKKLQNFTKLEINESPSPNRPNKLSTEVKKSFVLQDRITSFENMTPENPLLASSIRYSPMRSSTSIQNLYSDDRVNNTSKSSTLDSSTSFQNLYSGDGIKNSFKNLYADDGIKNSFANSYSDDTVKNSFVNSYSDDVVKNSFVNSYSDDVVKNSFVNSYPDDAVKNSSRNSTLDSSTSFQDMYCDDVSKSSSLDNSINSFQNGYSDDVVKSSVDTVPFRDIYSDSDDVLKMSSANNSFQNTSSDNVYMNSANNSFQNTSSDNVYMNSANSTSTENVNSSDKPFSKNFVTNIVQNQTENSTFSTLKATTPAEDSITKLELARDVAKAPVYPVEHTTKQTPTVSNYHDSPVDSPPTLPKCPPPPLDVEREIEQIEEFVRRATDSDYEEDHQVNYEPLSEAATGEPTYAAGENVYERINEPVYENIYEKVHEVEHQYQTLQEVNTQKPALPTWPPVMMEVLDATWTNSSRALPPSVPPPPPPQDDDELEPVQKEVTPPLDESKNVLRQKMSDFLGSQPQKLEAMTMMPPPDVNLILRQEREAERLIVQKQQIMARESPLLDPLLPQPYHPNYTWEDRMKDDASDTNQKDTNGHMQFQTQLDELEQEMEQHDRSVLNRLQEPAAPTLPPKLPSSYAPNIPPPAQYCERQMENQRYNSLQYHDSLEPAENSLQFQEFYTAPTIVQNQQNIEENTYLNENILNGFESEISNRNGNSNMTRRKPDAPRKDYNRHWLIQEAEQRRVEQQNQISRQKQETPKFSGQSSKSHFHNIKSNFNSSSEPQQIPYQGFHAAIEPSPTAPYESNTPSPKWNQQAKTYQPEIPSPQKKPLPEAIINTLTQRVKNKANLSNGNDENFHDYMNTGSQEATEEQRLLSVSGKKKCSHCAEELGRGAAMIIESLRLFYHIPCFKCCVCGMQLGNGTSGADVRVRNHKLHCHNCYSNDEGMKFSKV